MSYRFMRMLVFFDLPTETPQNKREYTRFRKFLIKNGFMMMQESVYCKIILNANAQKAMLHNLEKNKPSDGVVQILTITERQFSGMIYLIGEYNGDILNTDERLVEF